MFSVTRPWYVCFSSLVVFFIGMAVPSVSLEGTVEKSYDECKINRRMKESNRSIQLERAFVARKAL